MSEQANARRPVVFRLDGSDVTLGDGMADAARPRGPRSVVITADPELAETALAPETALRAPRRKIPWAALFWSATGGLISLALSLALVRLIEDLFARAAWLGWVGLALAIVAALALLALVARESIGLMRLAAVESLRTRAAQAIERDDREEARELLRELLAFTRKVPRLARARSELQRHAGEIIDGADLVRLAEREMLGPLDADAKRLVATAAKRVSVVTAVSPRAAVDMIFVLITAVRLIRSLADLYGGRPGALGLIRLLRLTLTHLALTGGMAAGDSIVQQMLGHGIAAKLSARLGEGVLNGLLTARLGLAAIEVTRPLPFAALPPPSMTDLAGGLVRGNREQPKASEPAG